MKGVLTALAVIMGIVTSVALVAQHAIASAATVFALGGLGTGFVSPPASEKITTWLDGQFDTRDNTLEGIDYEEEFFPFVGDTTLGDGVQSGVVLIDDAIASTAGPKVVVGESMGAAVIAEEKRTLLKSANPPPADELTFVVIGDPTQPRGLSSVLLGLRIPFLEIQAYEPAPETPYDTIIVIREYDAAADIPDDLTNVLAVVNTVLLGGPYVHADYHSVDLSTVPPENILEETNSLGGKTTTYFVPTRTLPLLEPLRDIGVPDELVDVVEKPVRAVVDSAYDRAPHENGGATVDSASATPISLDASLNIYFLRSGTTTTSRASVTSEPEKVTGDPATRQERFATRQE